LKTKNPENDQRAFHLYSIRGKRAANFSNILRVVARIWIALLIVGSLQPARPGILKGNHRPIHYVAFAGAALLLLASAYTRRQKILSASAIFPLGISLEVLQHLIYRNPMEWRDIADDGLAILAALALDYLAGRLVGRTSRSGCPLGRVLQGPLP
jgi:hypothetical protein